MDLMGAVSPPVDCKCCIKLNTVPTVSAWPSTFFFSFIEGFCFISVHFRPANGASLKAWHELSLRVNGKVKHKLITLMCKDKT